MRSAAVAQERDLLVNQHLQHDAVLVAFERLNEESGSIGWEHVERNDAHLGVVQSLTSHDDEFVNLALLCLEMVGHLSKMLAPPRTLHLHFCGSGA